MEPVEGHDRDRGEPVPLQIASQLKAHKCRLVRRNLGEEPPEVALAIDLRVEHVGFGEAHAADEPGGNIAGDTAENAQQGETYGTEFLTEWQATAHWKWTASYTLLQMHINPNAPGVSVNHHSPQNQKRTEGNRLRHFFLSNKHQKDSNQRPNNKRQKNRH